MLLRASVASAAFALSLVLAGCSAETSSPAAEATEQDVVARTLTNVKIQPEKLTWGLPAYYGGDEAHAAGVRAFLFDGEAGDQIVAKSSGDPGALYILEQTATGFSVLAKTNVSTVQGEAKATLRAAGTYALAYEIKDTKADPNAFFPDSFGASLTLTGKPVSPTKKLSLEVRDIWSTASDFSVLWEQFKAIDEKTLPPAALAEFKAFAAGSGPEPIAATWKVGSTTVYVVESRDEAAMAISFYDRDGALLGSATATETSEIAWTK